MICINARCDVWCTAGCEWGDKSPGWCSSIKTEQCYGYSVESRCCKTCHDRRAADPRRYMLPSQLSSYYNAWKVSLSVCLSVRLLAPSSVYPVARSWTHIMIENFYNFKGFGAKQFIRKFLIMARMSKVQIRFWRNFEIPVQ